MKKKPVIFWLVMLLFLANSCNLDSYDYEKLSNKVNLNPSIVAPIAKANISVWDLIQSSNQGNDSSIVKDPSGLIKIVYRQDDLFNYDVSELLKISDHEIFPSENNPLGEISPENTSTSRNISLKDMVANTNGAFDALVPLNGMTLPFPLLPPYTGPAISFSLPDVNDFTKIKLSKGFLKITMNNKLKIPITVTGSFYDLVSNQKIIDFTFEDIVPNEISIQTIPLENIELSNQVEFRLESFATTESSTPILINLDDYFTVNFDFIDLSILEGTIRTKAQTLHGYDGVYDFLVSEHPDMKAFKTVLKSGIMKIKTTNTSKLTGAMILVLNEVKGKNGLPVSASVPLSGNAVTIDLSGAEIDFTTYPAQPYNMIPYSYSIQVDKSNGFIEYASTDAIKMDISLTNLKYQTMHGDFGKRIIEIEPDNFAMDVDFLTKMEGKFKLANPKLELIIHNSIGMPASVSLDLSASNKDGKTETLKRTPPVFDIPVPANVNAGIATKSIVYDRQNSNIVDFIALPPTSKISYLGQADFNTTVPVTPQNPNFINLENAVFTIDLAMELPMELQVSNLAFKDTSAITGSDYENIESADLILNTENGIPLDVDIQLFFIDDNKNQIGSSKRSRILSAALVDASGAITPVKSSQSFSLDQSEMDNLRKATSIVFVGTVSSPSEGADVAPILWNSKINLNVVIKSKINL